MQEVTRQFNADRERFEEIVIGERALREQALMTADLLEEKIAKLTAENRRLAQERGAGPPGNESALRAVAIAGRRGRLFERRLQSLFCARSSFQVDLPDYRTSPQDSARSQLGFRLELPKEAERLCGSSRATRDPLIPNGGFDLIQAVSLISTGPALLVAVSALKE